MTKNTNDPFSNLILDEEERQLEAVLEKWDIVEAASLYRQLHTSKPVTLRINQLDLIKIKAKAKRNNIPYQTLLGAVVHDFAEDKTELTIK